MTSSVLLKTTMDENLKKLGLSREITNRIQKLRKGSGISIDDQIEVFYTLPAEAGIVTSVINDHSAKIQGLIKMPFMGDQDKQPGQVVIGVTKFENPAKPGEEVVLHVCKAAVHLVEKEC